MAVSGGFLLQIFAFCAVSLPGALCASTEDSLTEEQLAAVTWGAVALGVCFIALILYCADAVVVPKRSAPPWVFTVQPDPVIAQGGFSGSSDGITILNPQTVLRHRRGTFEVDGARWAPALSKGKHVFEIYWPIVMRGTLASVGVGSEDASMFVKPKASLVGNDRRSWGFDLARRKILHNAEMLGTLPKNGFVPDVFYMYVDCDSKTVGFGTQDTYYGAPLSIPAKAFPVYVMVGIMKENSQVTVKYLGSEVKQVQAVGTTVVAGQQDQVTIVTGDANVVVQS